MARKIYTRYKDIVEYLGYKQLDVYRVERNGKVVDIVRLMDPMTGKVGVIDLEAAREALSYREFLEKIVAGAESAGLPINERRVSVLRERFKEAPATAQEQREAGEAEEKEASGAQTAS